MKRKVKRLLDSSLLICWAAVLKMPPRKPIMAKEMASPRTMPRAAATRS